MIDLRSDTVTRPTPGMRQAMATAEVGDDVYGDDPTVNQLERRVDYAEGRADALSLAEGTATPSLADQISALAGSDKIDEELEAMKRALNPNGSGAAKYGDA